MTMLSDSDLINLTYNNHLVTIHITDAAADNCPFYGTQDWQVFYVSYMKSYIMGIVQIIKMDMHSENLKGEHIYCLAVRSHIHHAGIHINRITSKVSPTIRGHKPQRHISQTNVVIIWIVYDRSS